MKEGTTVNPIRLSLAFPVRAPPRRRSWVSPIRLLRLWWNRARERDELAALDERTLRDIGLSRYDVLQEANKPFWRI